MSFFVPAIHSRAAFIFDESPTQPSKPINTPAATPSRSTAQGPAVSVSYMGESTLSVPARPDVSSRNSTSSHHSSSGASTSSHGSFASLSTKDRITRFFEML